MTTKNYNALAAEMMGYRWEAGGVILPDGDNMEQFFWTPLENRNQAYQLLKRAEELGLAEQVNQNIRWHYTDEIDPYAPSDWQEFFWFLTCPTDIITVACVDVWLERQAEQEPIPEPTSFLEDAKEKFYQHLDSYHLQKAQEENQQ